MVQAESESYQVVLLIHGIRTEADSGPMVRSKLEVPADRGHPNQVRVLRRFPVLVSVFGPGTSRSSVFTLRYGNSGWPVRRTRMPSCRSSHIASGRTSSGRFSSRDSTFTSTV